MPIIIVTLYFSISLRQILSIYNHYVKKKQLQNKDFKI